jgi:negative regulator of sigma E activity
MPRSLGVLEQLEDALSTDAYGLAYGLKRHAGSSSFPYRRTELQADSLQPFLCLTGTKGEAT